MSEKLSTIKKGEILSCCWGYDMTINNYAKVIEVSATGKTVKCRMLNKIMNEGVHHGMGDGRAKAGSDENGPEFRLMVRGEDSFIGSYPFIARADKEDCSYRRGYFSRDNGAESYENHWD